MLNKEENIWKMIRVNELARELGVEPTIIIELLTEFGDVEKRSHSSSISVEIATAVRSRLGKASSRSLGASVPRQETATPAAKVPVPRISPIPPVFRRTTSPLPSSLSSTSFAKRPERERSKIEGQIERVMIAAEYAIQECGEFPKEWPESCEYPMRAYGLVLMYGLLHELFCALGILEPVTKDGSLNENDRSFGEHIEAFLGIVAPNDSDLRWSVKKRYREISDCRNNLCHARKGHKPSLAEVRENHMFLQKVLIDSASAAMNWVNTTLAEELEDVPRQLAHFIWTSVPALGAEKEKGSRLQP